MPLLSPIKDPSKKGLQEKKEGRKKKGEAVSSSWKRALKVKIERKHSRERQEEEKKVKRNEESFTGRGIEETKEVKEEWR